MKFKNRDSQSGFTLVEVLVAMFIISIMVAALSTLFSMSFTGIYGAGHKSETEFLAQENIEKAIARDSGADAVFVDDPIEGINGTIVKVEKADVNGNNILVKTFVREQPVWLQFKEEKFFIFEDEESIDVTVTRKGVTACEATVECYTDDGADTSTAIAGTHYVSTIQTLSFAAGETEKNMTIPVGFSPDSTNPDAESYKVILRINSPTASGGYNALLGFPNEAELYINERIIASEEP